MKLHKTWGLVERIASAARVQVVLAAKIVSDFYFKNCDVIGRPDHFERPPYNTVTLVPKPRLPALLLFKYRWGWPGKRCNRELVRQSDVLASGDIGPHRYVCSYPLT